MTLEFDGELTENQEMSWTVPQHSKKAVGRAGEALINPSSDEEYAQALTIVNNWRASHAFPLNSLQSSLRYRAQKISEEFLISQRLKRVKSIKGKLIRSPKMQLDRMQDIGGCRAILPTVKNVYDLKDLMVSKPTRCLPSREYDYIKVPKESGYRGIHLIYRFQGKKNSVYNGLLIEVQLRSQIQHAWATSVEIAGTFMDCALKSGEGPEEWLKFFQLVSLLFTELEDCIPENYDEEELKKAKEEAIQLGKKLSITDQLRAFSVVTEYSIPEGISGYFLLHLKIDERIVGVQHYPDEAVDLATSDYLNLEEASRNTNSNVVLVKAESIWNLKRAYPNYFADSHMFLDKLDEVFRPE